MAAARASAGGRRTRVPSSSWTRRPVRWQRSPAHRHTTRTCGRVASPPADYQTGSPTPTPARPAVARDRRGAAPASTLKPASVTAAVRAGNPLNGTYDCPAQRDDRQPGVQQLRDAGARSHLVPGGDHGLVRHRLLPARVRRVAPTRADPPSRRRTTRSSRWPPGSASGGAPGSTSPVRLPGASRPRVEAPTGEATKGAVCARARSGYPGSPTASGRHTSRQSPGRTAPTGGSSGRGRREPLDRAGRRHRDTLQMAVMYAAVANGAPS